jgi:hypothetical protein
LLILLANVDIGSVEQENTRPFWFCISCYKAKVKANMGM